MRNGGSERGRGGVRGVVDENGYSLCGEGGEVLINLGVMA